MELSSQEGDIPIPLNSTFGHGHGHMIHHDHIIPSSAVPSSLSMEDHHAHVLPYSKKAPVKYRECLKNHAASMGGNATDGCGEFMPSGEESTIEALNCSVCNCHRNFHRKEVEGHEHIQPSSFDCYPFRVNGRKLLLQPEALGYPRPTPHRIMSYNMGSLPSESDEHGGDRPVQVMKKRFRTKFSQEQKEKMLRFAENAGWKIQKQEESVVQQFCQEIGVRRRVLKVWMHNNKHNLAKKDTSNSTTTATTTVTDVAPVTGGV